MNQDGAFTGRATAYRNRNKKGSFGDVAFRFTDPDQMDILTDLGSLSNGGGINSHGDVSVRVGHGRGYVYTDRDGLLALDDLLVGDEADISMWMDMSPINVGPMTERDPITGFGQVGGTAHEYPASYAFVLTPVPAP